MTITISGRIDSNKAQALYDTIKCLSTARIIRYDHYAYNTYFDISFEDNKDYYDLISAIVRLETKITEKPEASWFKKQLRKLKCLFG